MENPLKSRTCGAAAPEGHPGAGGDIGLGTPAPIARLGGAPARRRGPVPTGSRPYRTYFAWNRATGLLKVGRSVDVPQRVRDLESSSGCKLTVLIELEGDREREWHYRLARYRTRGEWFRLPAGTCEAVEREQPRYRVDVLMGRKPRPLRNSTPVSARRPAPRPVGFSRLIDMIIAERRAK